MYYRYPVRVMQVLQVDEKPIFSLLGTEVFLCLEPLLPLKTSFDTPFAPFCLVSPNSLWAFCFRQPRQNFESILDDTPPVSPFQ